MKKKVILIGTGQMAIDYQKILSTLDCELIVVGRGVISAAKFESQTGIKPFIGGIQEFIKKSDKIENAYVIISTGIEQLMPTLLIMLKWNPKRILIEKPAAISINELIANEHYLKESLNKIFVAYNRRFYASVSEVKCMIDQDGGLETMHFEFTEWAHELENLIKAPGIKENWFFANSTHVIDLAFHLAGMPQKWKAFSMPGNLKWHSISKFTGAGFTTNGVLFSYLSNWESAGRWSLELMTRKRRIILKPLEAIYVQAKGSVVIEEHLFDNSFDRKYKPGLKLQIEYFLNGHKVNLLSMKQHIRMTKSVYNRMLG